MTGSATTGLPATGGTGHRPRLRAGVAVTADQDKITFLGATGSKEIRGEDALRTLLPVACLLDGSLSVSQLAARTGLAPGTVGQVCAFLDRHGLLDTGDRAADVPGPMARYLSSYLEVEPTAEAVTAQVALLERARVRVLAQPALAAALVADLRACGLGDAAAARAGELPASVRADGRPPLAVVQRGLLPDTETDRLVEELRQRGTPVLTFALHDDAVEVGPTFGPVGGACHRCYRDARAERIDATAPLSAGPGSGAGPSADLLVGLLGQEVLALTAAFAEPATRSAVLRLTLPQWAAERYLLAPQSGCGICGSDDRSAAIEAFEDAAELRRPAHPVPASVERRRRALIETLPRSRPAFVHHPRTPLPPVPDAVVTRDGTGRLTPESVATLLRLTAGFKEDGAAERPVRWTASGGNLASVELYAVFGQRFLGHPPGTVLRYDDLAHELVTVTTRPARSLAAPPARDTALGAALGTASGRSAAGTDEQAASGSGQAPGAEPGGEVLHLVLVANVGRLSAKYGDFGLRLAYLDAGCALEQLARVAELAGLCVRPGADGPRLASELELVVPGELITACVTVTAAAVANEEG